jgi:hypothetical protein
MIWKRRKERYTLKAERIYLFDFWGISNELWGKPYRLQHILVQFCSSGKNTIKPVSIVGSKEYSYSTKLNDVCEIEFLFNVCFFEREIAIMITYIIQEQMGLNSAREIE